MFASLNRSNPRVCNTLRQASRTAARLQAEAPAAVRHGPAAPCLTLQHPDTVPMVLAVRAPGASLQGAQAHPGWAIREVARRAATPCSTKLTRAEKRRARSRARAARHRNLGDTH